MKFQMKGNGEGWRRGGVDANYGNPQVLGSETCGTQCEAKAKGKGERQRRKAGEAARSKGIMEIRPYGMNRFWEAKPATSGRPAAPTAHRNLPFAGGAQVERHYVRHEGCGADLGAELVCGGGSGQGGFQGGEFGGEAGPIFGAFFGGDGSGGVGVILKDSGAKFGGDALEFILRNQIEEIGEGIVSHEVRAGFGGCAGVEIRIVEIEALGFHAVEQIFVVRESGVEAFHEQELGLRGRSAEFERAERADFRKNADEEGEEAFAGAGSVVASAVIFFVTGAGKIVEKLLLRHGRNVVMDFVPFEHPGDFRGLGDERADVVAVGIEGAIEIAEDAAERDAVGFLKGALEQRRGDFEADEIAVGVGGVALLGDFEDVEAEFGFQVRGGIVFVGGDEADFLFDFRVEKRDGAIDGDAVAVIVGGEVGERAEGEGVLVEVAIGFGIAKKSVDKITAAHVVREVAEEMAAVRVVAHVLDDGTAVGEGVGFAEIVGRGVWKMCFEDGEDVLRPGGIDDGFVREDRICRERRGKSEREQESSDDANNRHGAGMGAQVFDYSRGEKGGAAFVERERRGELR